MRGIQGNTFSHKKGKGRKMLYFGSSKARTSESRSHPSGRPNLVRRRYRFFNTLLRVMPNVRDISSLFCFNPISIQNNSSVRVMRGQMERKLCSTVG